MKFKQNDTTSITNLQEQFEVTVSTSLRTNIKYDDPLFEEAAVLISTLPVRKSDQWWVHPDIGNAQNRKIWRDCCKKLLILSKASPELLNWASDALIGYGNPDLALSVTPQPKLGERRSNQTDTILSLKYALGVKVSGLDIATLFGAKFAKFGRKNIASIGQFLEIRVAELQRRENRNLLAEWVKDAHTNSGGMNLFSGHGSSIVAETPVSYGFSLSSVAENFCVHLMRDAENTYRKEQGIPRVGEGWIGETVLFYEIKEVFSGEEVVQHARPEWLGQQHLDVYLPERSVALEYQGLQHDQPVAFFGGEEAFKKTVERDRRKQAICGHNACRIIYVREGYDLSNIISEIERI